VTVGIGVVGAGVVGGRRAGSAGRSTRSRVVAVADIDVSRASAVAATYGCRHYTDWRGLLEDPAVDAVAVCTVNRWLAPITVAALDAGKAVLCEKPMGRNGEEAVAMAEAARRSGRPLKVGFTLRFQRGLAAARRLCADGVLGPLYCVRAVYGHGGRQGYEREWRMDRDLAGGGELLDQGVHLLDLARWFLGDLDQVHGLAPCWHWGRGEVDDNAFVLLSNARGQVASLHASWTQWKNRFQFEVCGRDGSLEVEGLGGSYGPERLTLRRRRREGPPDEELVPLGPALSTWDADWADFMDAVELGRSPAVCGEEALEVMRMVDRVYETSGPLAVGARATFA
jgi:predicted dehydrogenase